MNKLFAMLAVVLFATSAFAAGEYKGGSGEAVKNWGARDFEQLKGMTSPMLIYIADEGYKMNQRAKVFESDILGSAEMKEKLKPYVQIRLDSDGKRGKGWTRDIINRGSNGAAILLMSSDQRFSLWIDKSTPKEQLNAKHLLKQMEMMAEYQNKLKAANELAEKKAEEEQKKKEAKELASKPQEEKSTKALEGFLGSKDDKDKAAFGDKKAAAPAEKKEEPKKKKAEVMDE
jgi:hypothetical protein